MHKKSNPKVKEILFLLGAGVFLTGSILIPGLPLLAKPLLNTKSNSERNEWTKYNAWRLKQVLKRLHKQKFVEVSETGNGYCVRISEKGKHRLLKYDLEELMITKKVWDLKWRIIIYDINEPKKKLRRIFQTMLRKLQFLQLQKSVYITPYPCENEIEFIKQIYNLDREVVLLTVTGIENEQAYKQYFGLS